MITVSKITSSLRLLLIPAILWLYLKEQLYADALSMIALSFLAEIVSVWAAYEYEEPSKGESFYSAAVDKMTQCALIVCLAGSVPFWWTLPVLFAVKEILHILDYRN